MYDGIFCIFESIRGEASRFKIRIIQIPRAVLRRVKRCRSSGELGGGAYDPQFWDRAFGR